MEESRPHPKEEERWDPFSLWGFRDMMLQPLADASRGIHTQSSAAATAEAPSTIMEETLKLRKAELEDLKQLKGEGLIDEDEWKKQSAAVLEKYK